MKQIKYKQKGQVHDADVYVGDLRKIKKTWYGALKANFHNIGDVVLLEVDGTSVRKPWAVFNTLRDWNALWNTDTESRYFQTITPEEVSPVSSDEYFLRYDDGLMRLETYNELLKHTEKYHEPVIFDIWYDEQLKSGRTRIDILSDLMSGDYEAY